MWNGKIIINHHFLKRLKKPNQIFAIWNDLFHHTVPDQFIINTFNVMASSQSLFLVCTKRPRRLLDIEHSLNPAKNIIVGSSCFSLDDSTQYFNLLNLSSIKRFKFFISFEPFIGSAFADLTINSKPEFAIIGHESGQNAAKSSIAHTLNLISQLKSFSIPIFTKQLYIDNKLFKHGTLPTELKLLYE
jgi:protein gp37